MLVIEKTFGFISSVTLIELSNTSKDLLRQLSEVAPGTFQHSVMVSNLAAEIANKIGAKAQLVRTGAMYQRIVEVELQAGLVTRLGEFAEDVAPERRLHDVVPVVDLRRPKREAVVVTRSDRVGAALFHGDLEAAQVDIAQRALGNVGADKGAAVLLIIGAEVLDRAGNRGVMLLGLLLYIWLGANPPYF